MENNNNLHMTCQCKQPGLLSCQVFHFPQTEWPKKGVVDLVLLELLIKGGCLLKEIIVIEVVLKVLHRGHTANACSLRRIELRHRVSGEIMPRIFQLPRNITPCQRMYVDVVGSFKGTIYS